MCILSNSIRSVLCRTDLDMRAHAPDNDSGGFVPAGHGSQSHQDAMWEERSPERTQDEEGLQRARARALCAGRASLPIGGSDLADTQQQQYVSICVPKGLTGASQVGDAELKRGREHDCGNHARGRRRNLALH